LVDALGQLLAYVYSRKSAADARIAGVLTEDEARRIASNVAKLPTLLGAADHSALDFPEGGGQLALASADALFVTTLFFCAE
jgi:hypothetical protein